MASSVLKGDAAAPLQVQHAVSAIPAADLDAELNTLLAKAAGGDNAV